MMLNSLADIKRLWPGDALNIDNEEYVEFPDKDYDLYLKSVGKKIELRLKKWVGTQAYEDAASETPADELRAESLKEAEMELVHVNLMEKLWRDKSAGVERDVQLPSGMRVTLQAFSTDEYERIIKAHVDEAYRLASEYIE